MWRIPLPEALQPLIEVYRLDLMLNREPLREVASLAVEERQRARHFVRCEDRVRYAATRAAVRQLIAASANCSCANVRILQGLHGKPVAEVAGRSAPPFNVAHSGAHALIAIGSASRIDHVGVDIEKCDAAANIDALCNTAFTEPERRAIRAAGDPLAALYAHWVAKEAALKAMGLGIAKHLQSISVQISQENAACIRIESHCKDLPPVQVVGLLAPKGYAAALAWRQEETSTTMGREPTALPRSRA